MVEQNSKRNIAPVNRDRKSSMAPEHQWPSLCSMGTVPQIIRLPEVRRLTGLSKSTVYAKMDGKSPYFDSGWPKKVSLGPRSVGWYRHEVIEWVESRTSSSVWGV